MCLLIRFRTTLYIDVCQRLGNTVRCWRVDNGFNIIDFCLMARISRPLLDKIESGQANVTISTLARLAEAMDMDVPDLFL